MQEIFNIYKPLGWTPLEAIQKLEETHPGLENTSLTYAGRLDPAAEGVLLVVAGKAIGQKNDYLGLDKTYQAKVLFGFETDTYDALGLADKTPDVEIERPKIENKLREYTGFKKFKVPPYSSIPIQGKPLFQWARENQLDQIEIPVKEFEIKNLHLINLESKTGLELKSQILNTVDLVKGDFRQDEIKNRWAEILDQLENQHFSIAEIEIQCGSGTYIRSIANQLGKDLGTSAILLNLIRTRVGNYDIKESINLK